MKEKSGITPRALLDRPALKDQYLQLYRDFGMLNRGRSAGMSGPASLTLTDFAAFFSIFPQPSPELRERWIRIMQRVDAAVLNKIYEKLKQA